MQFRTRLTFYLLSLALLARPFGFLSFFLFCTVSQQSSTLRHLNQLK